MIRQYSRDKWERYWKEKLGIKDYLNIQIGGQVNYDDASTFEHCQKMKSKRKELEI